MGFQVVGYVRVSSVDQNPERQLADLNLDRKFIDYFTGSKIERPELNKCIEYVREGDTLLIHSIDRLARNLIDLQSIIHTILKKGVSIKFIKENLAFNSTQDPMAILTLQIMGAFAEFERTMIRSRQREGIDAAKKAGKHLGRPSKIDKNFQEKVKTLLGMKTSIRQIAFKMNVSRATIYKVIEKIKI